MRVNQRQLECFLAVADHRGFGRAAQSLHLGQATVSEAVAALERSLGAPLFVRSTRRTSLTPFGERFAAQTRGPYEALESAFIAARRSQHARSDLVVAHTPELGQLLLPSLLEAVGRVGPHWTPLRLHTHDQIAALARGDIDVGLCWQPRVRAPSSKVLLARCPAVVVLREDDELSLQPTLRVADLAGRRILTTPRRHNRFMAARLESAVMSADLDLDALEEFDHYDDISVAVATSSSSVGLHPATIALLPTPAGIVLRRLDEESVVYDVAAILPADSSEPQRHIVRVLREAMAVANDRLAALFGA